MGCCGERGKDEDNASRPEQRWDYINLSDFKSSSCLTPLSYGVLYISLIISIAVYLVDIFTAANLLFFNRWSGQVQPLIPFHVARWIFAGCIILSWVLLAYRWLRAVRVMRRGIVAASYLDPLAVRIQSVRIGSNGHGWRRFLLFAELTKGRRGAEYVALFAFFSFEAWLRIVFAEGPRQIINAITLYTVMRANLIPIDQHAPSEGLTPIAQFFVNIQILANANSLQAAILFGMLFTLIVWVFTVIGLILACLFYVIFLWHQIPSQDGTLARYCRRKVDKRLAQIVGVKITKAIERENKRGLDGKSKLHSQLKHQPTLPMVDDDISVLSKHTSQSPDAYRGPHSSFGSIIHHDEERRLGTLSGFDRPAPPSRLASQLSALSSDSYTSDEPLMRGATEMGYAAPHRQYAPVRSSRMGSDVNLANSKPSLSRLTTQNSQSSHESGRVVPSRAQYLDGPYNYNHNEGAMPSMAPGSFVLGAARSVSPISVMNRPQGRRIDNYDMDVHEAKPSVISPASTGYTAFNPSMIYAGIRQGSQHPLRSYTAPPQQQALDRYR